MTNPKFKIAEQDHDCNACEFIKDCYKDFYDDLTEEQQAVIERAKAKGWKVLKGERCRVYTWAKGTSEEMLCIEIPEVAELVSDLDMWP